MGVFEKVFAKKEALKVARSYFEALSAYQPVFTSWNGQIYESELVRAAIDARARHNSKLKVIAKGNVTPRLDKCFKIRPNSFMTWTQFLYRLSTILDVQNTAFILPVIDPLTNMLTGYYPAMPSRTEILEDEKGNPWIRYTFSNGQVGVVEYERCGILTKYQLKDDFFGESNKALTDTMDLIHIQKQGIQIAVKNSATYRFMAKVTNFTKPEDLKKEREKFSEKNLEADSKGGLLLFPNTYSDIQQLKNTPYTVDPEQSKQINANVFNYFGVNDDILQNKAIGDALNAFYEGAIAPFAIQLSEVLTLMTFSESEILNGSAVQTVSARLPYLSAKDKLEVAAQMADRGIMSRNEVRAIWDLEPIEGGDNYTIRGEYYLLDKDGNMILKESNNGEED